MACGGISLVLALMGLAAWGGYSYRRYQAKAIKAIPTEVKLSKNEITLNEKTVRENAEHCVFLAICTIRENYAKEDAELELSQQRLAGEAQLKAIKANEAIADLASSEKEFEENVCALATMEKTMGNPGRYSLPIQKFKRFGEHLGFRTVVAKKYNGISSPEHDRLFNDYLKLSTMNLDMVMITDFSETPKTPVAKEN